MKRLLLLLFTTALIPAGATENLLLNPDFGFHSFDASRSAKKQGYTTGSVPFWDQDAYGDAEAWRAPLNPLARPTVPVDGVVILHPGKSLRQVRLLGELRLDPGEEARLSVRGYQATSGALHATVRGLRLDNQPGTWSPSELGQTAQGSYPRAARGEPIPLELAAATAPGTGDFELSLPPIKIPSDGAAWVGLEVVFTNRSDHAVALYAPRLTSAATAGRTPETALPQAYRHLPRTLSRLRRGEPLHVVIMGSSIDRGSANPPLYRYDEDPASPTFKQPLSAADFLFNGSEVGHPEWTPYFGQWRHYFSSTGRLRRALMRRFDYPIHKLLFNYMARDGSAIGESHSALEEWAELRRPPDPEWNGHQRGKTWAELYPELMARPEGPRPDLVIFGSGANDKIDGPEEIAAFEGAIRWFQRRYPGVEFLFCMWQHTESSTPNAGMLEELALRYGIPYLDIGRTLSLATRHAPGPLFTPKDGHPQAAAHALWARSLEAAFQPVDPVGPGFPQQHLPERATPTTLGWEGEMTTYEKDSPRLRNGTAFLLDDTVANLWATGGNGKKVEVHIDGQPPKAFDNRSRRLPSSGRDPRNSTLSIGHLALGERHLLEVGGNARIVAVDAKTVLNRRHHGVESREWKLPRPATPFASEWGAPYGSHQATLRPGETAVLEWVGTDCSVAWASREGAGKLVARVDGKERLRRPAGEPVRLASGELLHMESRAGILHLPYGAHRLEVQAEGGEVHLLGAFTYDTRPNLANRRILHGHAQPGETVVFTPPFRATPVIWSTGGVKLREATPAQATFSGEPGNFQAEGE